MLEAEAEAGKGTPLGLLGQEELVEGALLVVSVGSMLPIWEGRKR